MCTCHFNIWPVLVFSPIFCKVIMLTSLMILIHPCTTTVSTICIVQRKFARRWFGSYVVAWRVTHVPNVDMCASHVRGQAPGLYPLVVMEEMMGFLRPRVNRMGPLRSLTGRKNRVTCACKESTVQVCRRVVPFCQRRLCALDGRQIERERERERERESI